MNSSENPKRMKKKSGTIADADQAGRDAARVIAVTHASSTAIDQETAMSPTIPGTMKGMYVEITSDKS